MKTSLSASELLRVTKVSHSTKSLRQAHLFLFREANKVQAQEVLFLAWFTFLRMGSSNPTLTMAASLLIASKFEAMEHERLRGQDIAELVLKSKHVTGLVSVSELVKEE